MKKVLTAINNPKLNEELKKEKNLEVIGKDIQYKEAILEILEKNKEINLLIVSEKIPGEIKLDKLIQKIKLINKRIKIIFILEKENNKLEKILSKNRIIDIYYNNKINLNELIKIIKKNEINMEEEIIKLKKIIEENNKKNSKKIKNIYNFKKIIIRIMKKNKKRDKQKETGKKKKIITISGNNNSGKSTIALISSAYLAKEDNKTLLVDGDFINRDLKFILKDKNKKEKKYNKYFKNKSKKYKKNKIKLNKKINNKKLINKKNKIMDKKINKIINENIKEIKKNFYFFGEIKKIFFKNIKEKNIKKILKIFFKNIKGKFDIIIFDLSKNNISIINKEIIKKSNLNFIVTEPEILGVRETKKIINKYIRNWEIPQKKVYIICNRKKFFSLDKELIYKKLEIKNKIIEIKENESYNFWTNYLIKNIFSLNNKKIKKEIEKIIKIIKNN